MMFCPACGKNNPEESAYCNQCGAYLRAETSEGETTITLSPVEAEVEQEEDIQVPEEELIAHYHHGLSEV